MTNLPDMAGAAAEIELSGKTYRARPLEVDEFAEFERWVDDEPIRRALRNLDGAPQPLQMEMLKQANAEVAKNKEIVGISQADVKASLVRRQKRIAATMMSMEGTAFLLWLSLHREQPELSKEEVSKMIPLERLVYVQDRIDTINGFSSPSQPTGGHLKRKAPRKRKHPTGPKRTRPS